MPSPLEIEAQRFLLNKDRQQDLSVALGVPTGTSRISVPDSEVAKALCDILERETTAPRDKINVIEEHGKHYVIAPTSAFADARSAVQGRGK